jgi:SAM-dependent methyltransferase
MVSSFYTSQLFDTNFSSIFLNPFYFIRKGLNRIIKKEAPGFEGILLDFGCGSKPYEKHFTNLKKYIGIDIDDRGHEHKNEKVDVYYDGQKIPFDDQYFDVVFASEVFEHVDNLDDMIIEIRRVLKPNGKIFITVPFVFMEHEIPYDFRRFSDYGISLFLSKNGFEIQTKHKSTKDIETLFQNWNVYLYSLFMDSNKYLRLLLTILLIAPFNILGALLATVMPNKNKFYSNMAVVAQKV